MPTRFTEFHISSPVPSMSLRAKDHLEGTKVAVSPRYCAVQKVQTGSAAAGGHRRVATRETTGDLATRRVAGDPETRAEWMKVLRYSGLHRSWWTLVYARSGTTPRRAALLDSTRFGASSMAYRLSATKVTDTFLLSRLGSTRITVQNFARDAERFLVQRAVSQIVDSLLPSRAVGVDAPPRPG